MSTNNANFKQNFCSSPWIHLKINSSGDYDYCRWADPQGAANIKDVAPDVYFQQHMSSIRKEFLSGNMNPRCHPCRDMEKQGKISGRQRQLLKIGVRVEHFEKTLASSPWREVLVDDDFSQLPQDWQIDLGNYCNSACIFCAPRSSSRLAAEWKKIGFIDSLPKANWSDDPALVQKFIDTLKKSPSVRYVHFIGGETLIMPSFRLILQALVDSGLNKTATVGFTTNLTVWDDDIIKLLEQFDNVNVGLSLESFDKVNEYVRWPIDMSTMHETLQRWVSAAKNNGWLTQIRTTPSCLTLHKIIPIYDYALKNNVNVESCNFLYSPEVLKPAVLPKHYRAGIVQDMQNWIDKYQNQSGTLINTRHPDMVQAQLVQDLSSYVNYLNNQPDESYRLPELMSWLKRLESSRGNSILTYLPEYEELFKSAGY